MSAFARTPPPPYYAVIFTSMRPADDAGEDDGYAAMADAMVERAATMPGFLGLESARGADGLGLTVSYWRSEADIAHWRADAEHRVARERGRSAWYRHFELRVARVERAYGGPDGDPG